jgi:RNA polymerase sigma-70 factor (sigma-E family)
MVPVVDDGPTTLEELFRTHATALLRLAVLLTGDPAGAEELVQDAFLRYHRSGAPPRPGAELAYLRRTVINLSHDHHHRLGLARRLVPERPSVAPSPEAEAVAADRHLVVLAAIRALPERQRACVVLRYFAELTDIEIADALGVSAGSVKTHLHRARAALAERLEVLR